MLEESLRFVIRSEMEKVLELYLSNKFFCGISEDKLVAIEEGANLTYEEDVKPLLIKLVKDKGKDAAKAVLDHFFASNGSQLAREDWPAFITMANNAMTWRG